eukprot:15431832-Alexandrium_andersonii.AAC.1
MSPGPKIQPGRSRSQLGQRAKRPCPQLGICRNRSPAFQRLAPEAPHFAAPGSALWEAPSYADSEPRRG